jgi:hypothetical protein
MWLLDIASFVTPPRSLPRRLLPIQSYIISLHDAAQPICLHTWLLASAARRSLKSISPTGGTAAFGHSLHFVRDV